MTYIQGGVDNFEARDELVRAIRVDPRGVWFYGTALVGSNWSGRISDLPAGMRITIWGPDPHRDRQWKVTVVRSPRGFMVT